MDPNNNTLYVIGDGGNAPPGYTSPKPLFIVVNESADYYLAVVGANGAKSLSLSDGGECLYVTTESCVLAVSGQGGRVQSIAGDCTEGGMRNGPLMYARFMSLTAISTGKQPSFFFMAILDSGRANNILLANSWSVREIGQVLGAFDLSLVVERKGKSKEEEKIEEEIEESIAVLVLTPISAIFIWGKDDERGGNGSFISSNWKQHSILSADLLVDDGSSSSSGHFTACLLKGNINNDSPTRIGNLTYTAYVMDDVGALWVSLLLSSDKAVQVQVYKTPSVNIVVTKLVWGKSLDGSVSLKGLDTQGKTFIHVNINDDDIITSANISSNNSNNSLERELCTNPWQVACDVGYMMKNQTCIESPPGGYFFGSSFVQCPKGTYNPSPMAVSYLACKKCDPGFIAPLEGTVVCSACNESFGWQSASGDQCLSKCPQWSQDTEALICKNCLPGSSFNNKDQKCQPCPAKTSSVIGGQCLPCAQNTSSPEGSKFCYKRCQQQLCSNNGLRLCLAWKPPYLVSTIANLQNIPGRFLSLAISSNGTMFTGNNQGVLVISSIGSIQMGLSGVDAMALSVDEMYLFIADKGSRKVMKVSNLGSESSILANNISAKSICATLRGLYVIDELSNNLLLLTGQEGSVAIVANALNLLWLLLSVTPHEDKHSLVILAISNSTKLASIWQLIPENSSPTTTTTTFGPLSYVTTTTTVMPWISRWEKGKSTICIGHSMIGIADDSSLIQTSSNFTLYNSTIQQQDKEWEIIAGNQGKAGHVDDEGQASRFISPIAAAAASSNYDGSILFLLEDQTSTIRTVYARPCECIPDFYMLNGTCLPCHEQTHSMSGSRGCSTCPSGEYLDKYGDCMVCPEMFWWIDRMYDPCRKMQGTGSNKNMMIGLTLFEAQSMMVGMDDIVSTATILIPNLNKIPPSDILIRGDLLGRLWHVSQRMTPNPFDPQGISIQSKPGIWALCSPVVFLGEECNCWHAPLLLGYDESWRDQAAGILNITRSSIFVLRPDDLYTTSPILIAFAGGSIKLNPKTPMGDMGLCFVGWPAQFNCTDPNYVWTFPSEQYPGGACLPCPSGTIAETHSSVKCTAISNKNPLCNPGTYKIPSGGFYACNVCPENTYSISQGAIRCKPKVTVACLPGFYVSDGGPTSDNTCKPCVPCIVGESVMMPFLSNPCPGNTKSQPYFCVSWMQAMPGFFASVAFGNDDNPNLIRYNPCNNLPSHAVWGNGPYHDLCYFRCKFRVNEALVREYAFFFALGSAENEQRWPGGGDTNLFPYLPPPLSFSGSIYSNNNNQVNADRAMASICSPCNTSACPAGMWRPLWAEGCGPPCLISPNLCQGRSDGCVAICDVSINAVVVGFGTDDQGRAICIWRCNIGWVKIREDKCAVCNASLCAAGEKYVGNSQCNPEARLSELCIPCPATASEGGVLSINISERGKCSYTCVDGYPNPNPQSQMADFCIQCAASVTRCPAGFSVTCGLNPCSQCQNPNTLAGRAALVPTGDSICRVQCKPGYHTINLKDFTVISSISIGHDPSQILCDECSKWPGLACPTLSCSPGYQQKKSGFCTPCQTSFEMGCPKGTYAPQCPGGGGVTQVGWCLTCPIHLLLVANAADDIVPGQWPTRIFVPYSIVKTSGVTLVGEGDCPTACVDGSVQVNTGIKVVCMACSSMLPAPPDNAPYKTFSSSWNASDGIRWWPPEFDPPHLSSQKSWFNSNQMEKRAGVCWPCPPLPLMGDPCFSSSSDQTANGGQLLLGGEGVLHVDELLPKPQQFPWAGAGRRRLLSLTTALSCNRGSYAMPPLGSWCSVCPLDHYCNGGISQPIRCGAFFSAGLGSQTIENCTCRAGFALNQITRECVLLNQVFECPPGFYKSSNSFQDKRSSVAPCMPCPSGTYEVNGMCQDCPLQSGSTEGSIKCTCVAGKQIIVLSQKESGSSEECQADCIIGSPSFDGSKCQTCSVSMAMVMPFPLASCSCGPGTYYQDNQNMCEPCPKGTFSQTAGYAPCILCPETMTTLYTGASTLASCIFLEMDKN